MNDSSPDAREIFFAILREGEYQDAPKEAVKRHVNPDDEVFEEVLELLKAHVKDSRLLDDLTDVVDPPSASGAEASVGEVTEGPGDWIGPYLLLERIGEGGMGIVFLARQAEPLERTVALKILKPGMDTKAVIARFEAERQALAIMDHPGIARVFDAGSTATGRPFFVMERIKGIPVTGYCRRYEVGLRERLDLFTSICAAVQHAHLKGIIHRDLKPSNILVTLYDGQPVTKIIDFGIAKATARRLTEKTLYTGHGEMLGTPLYMSPEQVDISAHDVDTRSDVYSLGILLYELLTGTTPLTKKRLLESALYEVIRIIREEDPPRPSTRVTTGDVPKEELSPGLHEPSSRLDRLLRGDLDSIVMKAISKDRSIRYQSASELASDVVRHMEGVPILAVPPGILYRTKKWLRRNRRAVLAILLVLVVAGVAGIAVDLFRRSEKDKRDILAREASEARMKHQAERERRGEAESGEKEKGLQASANLLAQMAVRSLESDPEKALTLAYEAHHLVDDRTTRLTLAGAAARIPRRGLALDVPRAGGSLRWLTSDGERLVVITREGDCGIWAISTGKRLSRFQLHPEGVTRSREDRVDPTGTWYADLGGRGPGSSETPDLAWRRSIDLWNLDTGDRRSLSLAPGGEEFWRYEALEFSEDGRSLMARREGGGGKRLIDVWRMDSMEGQTLRLPEGAGIASMTLSPEGSWLAVTSSRSLYIWDLAARRMAFSWSPGEEDHRHFRKARFSGDGKRLFVPLQPGIEEEEDACLMALDMEGRKWITRCESPSREWNESLEWTGTARVWIGVRKHGVERIDLGTGEVTTLLDRSPGHRVLFDRDRTIMLVWSESGTVAIHDLGGGRDPLEFGGPEDMIPGAAMSPDGFFALWRLEERVVEIREPAGRLIRSIPISLPELVSGYRLFLALGPEGRDLVVSTDDEQPAYLFSRGREQIVPALRKESVKACLTGGTHPRLCVLEKGGRITFLDPSTLEEEGRVDLPDRSTGNPGERLWSVSRMTWCEPTRRLVVWYPPYLALIDPQGAKVVWRRDLSKSGEPLNISVLGSSGLNFLCEGQGIHLELLDGRQYLVDARSGRTRRELELQGPRKGFLNWTRGRYLELTCSGENWSSSVPAVHDWETGNLLETLPRLEGVHPQRMHWLSEDRGSMVWAVFEGRGSYTFRGIDTRTKAVFHRRMSCLYAALHPDGMHLMIVPERGAVEIVEMATLRTKEHLSLPGSVCFFKASGDGRTGFGAQMDGGESFVAWEMETGRILLNLTPDEMNAGSGACDEYSEPLLTRDGSLLITFTREWIRSWPVDMVRAVKNAGIAPLPAGEHRALVEKGIHLEGRESR